MIKICIYSTEIKRIDSDVYPRNESFYNWSVFVTNLCFCFSIWNNLCWIDDSPKSENFVILELRLKYTKKIVNFILVLFSKFNSYGECVKGFYMKVFLIRYFINNSKITRSNFNHIPGKNYATLTVKISYTVVTIVSHG